LPAEKNLLQGKGGYMTKLEMIRIVSDYFQKANESDSSMVIADKNAVILDYRPGRDHDTKARPGDVLKGKSKDALATKQIVSVTVPENIYGFRLKGNAVPIIEDDGEVSGMLIISTSMRLQDTLHTTAESIAATAEQLSATTDELASTAVRLAEDLNKVKSGSDLVLAEINKTGDILKFVSDVAANSNLLGLNAAIEAARAGEQGRGFAVVADEIRKMAVNCAQSVNDIKKILQNIHDETTAIVTTIASSAALSERQAVATGQVGATMQQLAVSASEIEKVADTM
jgi:uncharacterized protein YukE